ncbi:uncharacterized protein [Clytia hemisphaerica]
MAGKKAVKFSFLIEDPKIWKQYKESYAVVFQKFCLNPKKRILKGLDEWFQNEFGKEIHERNPHHLVKEDLKKLMEWKLTRGKFRPRLTQMIAENKEEDIRTYSEEAFKNIDDPKKCIERLCKLRAVGPATASAILTAYKPEKYAFMADEAVQSVLSGKIDYTLKYYLKFLDEVRLKAKQLSATDDTTWTPHQIEICLWTAAMATKLDVNMSNEVKEEKPGSKRKSTDQLETSKKAKKVKSKN